ncbi:MAG: dihydroorotate dehydrogenase electron transfer subunit [Solirubrobacteraceae bacterium]
MRVRAPFGRRLVAVTGVEDVGAYRVLHAADSDGPTPWPGQFYMLAAAEGWGAGEDERPYLPRALSFLGAADGRLSFMLEDVGPGTRRLCGLATGDELWLTGPLGNGFDAPPEGRRAILAGGGVGIPPLAAWAVALHTGGATASAVLGFRDARHAEGARLLGASCPHMIATDDGSVGHHGLVTDLLAEDLDDDQQAVVYSCGPPAMLEAVRALCAARDVPAQIALEAGMACGFGACFGCAVAVRDGGYVRVCVDGPVLDAGRLDAVPAH